MYSKDRRKIYCHQSYIIIGHDIRIDFHPTAVPVLYLFLSSSLLIRVMNF